jgi:glycosyltransferase involved in cell wall biosynthesis
MNSDSSPERVLFVDHTAKMGGGEIALLNLAQSLDRSRYEPVVALFSDGPLADRLRDLRIETHVVPLSGRVLNSRKDALGFSTLMRLADLAATLAHVRRLARFMREQRIDLVHTNSLKADVIGGIAARLAGKPLIWHVRDRIHRDYLPGMVVRVFRWLCGVVPDRVIANSQATLDTLRPAKLNRSDTVHSGIEPRMRVVHDGLRVVAPAAVTRSIRRVGLVGRISPWKGQDIFLKAAAIVHQRFPEVCFQIIGSPLFAEHEYERELKRLCQSLGLDECVEFTGFCENVPEVLAYLEVLVHASTTGEPFGQVVIEGMVAGKPVVATDGGGIPEIVVDSVTGLLVPMGEVAPMARAICHLLQNPELAGEMGRAGRERVLERFTIEQTAGNVERVYEELLSRTARSAAGDAPIDSTDTGQHMAAIPRWR